MIVAINPIECNNGIYDKEHARPMVQYIQIDEYIKCILFITL